MQWWGPKGFKNTFHEFESAEVCAKLKPICVPANEENFDRLTAELEKMV